MTLSKTEKKTREDKEKIFQDIQQEVDKYRYVWVFSVSNMRNTFLKDVRQDWTGSRILFGRTKVMAKALGTSPEEAYLPNLDKLAGPQYNYMKGGRPEAPLKSTENVEVGLLLTNETPETVREYFDSFVKKDFARAGIISPVSFVVPEGIVYSTGGQLPAEDDVPLPHSMEATLRQLGMPTRLKAGKIIIDQPYEVCSEGKPLNSNQTRLLKTFGLAVADFRMNLLAYYDKEVENVFDEAEEKAKK